MQSNSNTRARTLLLLGALIQLMAMFALVFYQYRYLPSIITNKVYEQVYQKFSQNYPGGLITPEDKQALNDLKALQRNPYIIGFYNYEYLRDSFCDAEMIKLRNLRDNHNQLTSSLEKKLINLEYLVKTQGDNSDYRNQLTTLQSHIISLKADHKAKEEELITEINQKFNKLFVIALNELDSNYKVDACFAVTGAGATTKRISRQASSVVVVEDITNKLISLVQNYK